MKFTKSYLKNVIMEELESMSGMKQEAAEQGSNSNVAQEVIDVLEKAIPAMQRHVRYGEDYKSFLQLTKPLTDLVMKLRRELPQEPYKGGGGGAGTLLRKRPTYDSSGEYSGSELD